MTSEAKPRLKITYATLRNDNEELHALYETGLVTARTRLRQYHPNLIGGKPRDGEGVITVRTPIDTDIVVGTFATGTRGDVVDAAARAAQPAWAAMPWRERLAIIRRAAELISERQMEYAALMAIEVGKNRLEALGEVEETADLRRYYADIFERNDGYDHPLDNLGDATVHTRTILRPFGIFAVISPFNFPMALAGGPTSAALMAGNTVVFKPSSTAPLSAVKLMEVYRDAGLPDGVINLVMGPGETVGDELQTNPGIDGIVFTGSHEVGFALFKRFSSRFPRPCIVEMGGKNPAIVTAKADLEEAAEGIMRAAFGFGGQKCSANSRVYVERPVHDELVRLLVEKTEAITVGDPLLREHWLGPVIDQRAVERHQAAVVDARRDGAVFTGGQRLTDQGMDRGFYVEPTIVGNLPLDHRLFRDELFAPFLAVGAVDSLEEAIRLSNESVYGLTAGIFSEDRAEVQQFLDGIHSGVLYVNRRAGATTGAGISAGRPGLRWLEGLRIDRQGRPLDVLRGPVHARAESHRRRLRQTIGWLCCGGRRGEVGRSSTDVRDRDDGEGPDDARPFDERTAVARTGPSMVHPRVMAAIAAPLIGHLDPEFLLLMDRTQELLRYAFQTQNRMTIPVSGTGSAAIEPAVDSIIEPGDQVLVCVNGYFGLRMAEMARRHGAQVVTIERPWGDVFSPDEVREALRTGVTKLVGIVHAETSTGAQQPLDGIAEVVHDAGALFLVDAVTSLCGVPVRVDDVDIDVCSAARRSALAVHRASGRSPSPICQALGPRRCSLAGPPVRSWYLDLTLVQRYWGPNAPVTTPRRSALTSPSTRGCEWSPRRLSRPASLGTRRTLSSSGMASRTWA